MSAATLHIEVAYATPTKQWLIELQVDPACTVQQAIEQSGLLQQCPEISLDVNKVGIFSRTCALDAPLREHDRIEIYRALQADPKDARRRRVEAKRPPRKR